MYVKVQRGATIKKLKIDGPEKATLEQLFRPFRNMNLKGEDIQTEHYCLALINKNLDADIIIHSDQQLKKMLASKDYSEKSTNVKLRIVKRSSQGGISNDADEYQMVPNMTCDSRSNKLAKDTYRRLSDCIQQNRGQYYSEQINLVNEKWFQFQNIYNQSMIQVDELRLKDIKAELSLIQENIRKIEVKARPTDVKSLLDFAFEYEN